MATWTSWLVVHLLSHYWVGMVNQGVDGRKILRWISRKWDGGGMDWINLAQNKDRRRAHVIAVMNLRVP